MIKNEIKKCLILHIKDIMNVKLPICMLDWLDKIYIMHSTGLSRNPSEYAMQLLENNPNIINSGLVVSKSVSYTVARK